MINVCSESTSQFVGVRRNCPILARFGGEAKLGLDSVNVCI